MGRSGSIMSVKRFTMILITLILSILIAFVGTFLFGDRYYYLTSILIIILTLFMFFLQFEKRKPKTREVVLISVLCTIAVLGRVIFSITPQFKPIIAIIILSAIVFGSETGFMVGSISTFVSNFLFGQGPWTAWQMITMGLIGFITGIVFKDKKISTIVICVYGFLMTFLFYGLIMNISTGLMYMDSWDFVLTSIITGLVFDLIHAISTVVFLAVLTKPMVFKLNRVKDKYGLLN